MISTFPPPIDITLLISGELIFENSSGQLS
jgi:hypothetical protein